MSECTGREPQLSEGLTGLEPCLSTSQYERVRGALSVDAWKRFYSQDWDEILIKPTVYDSLLAELGDRLEHEIMIAFSTPFSPVHADWLK